MNGGHTLHRRPATAKMTLLIAVAIALSVAPWLGWLRPTSVEANHYWPPSDPKHLATMHNSVDSEDMCAQTADSSITNEQLKSYLGVLLSGNSTVWDGTGNWNINLYPTSYNCDAYGYYPNNSWIEVFATAWTTTPAYCGGASCVNFGVPIIVNGVTLHYWQGYMQLLAFHISPSGTAASRNSTINHEFGHIVGLRDPLDTLCTNFPWSVMHQYDRYGCPSATYIQWPYPNDRLSVEQNKMPSD